MATPIGALIFANIIGAATIATIIADIKRGIITIATIGAIAADRTIDGTHGLVSQAGA